MDNSKCVILVPVASYIKPHCDLSLRQLEAMGYIVRRWYGSSQIDVARNRLATDALAEGFEELMWIDADIAFDPRSVERLRSHGLPVVCAIYPKKLEKELASHLTKETKQLTFGQGGGLVEILYAATGFLYTRREVYLDVQREENLPVCNQRLGQPTVPFFLPMVISDGSGHRYLAEDFAFCERLRRCRYRIYADTTIRLQHIGKYGYSWEDVGSSLPRYATYQLKIQDEDGLTSGPG
ncbi:MAG: hypothetical protein ACM338_02605 [Betaproteobacteria bacterium]